LGKIIAQDKDDIYFLGKNENNFLDVYLIRNFMVKPVGSHYIRTILNYYSGGTSNSITGIQTIALDNHTMILITFNFTNQAVAYFPESEEWWSMTTTDFVGRGAVTNTILGTQSQPSGSISTQRPYYLTYNFQNDAMVTVNTSDVETTLPITATYYSEVIDMDTSYWKHISKVMAVGDYGNRTLTLWYSRDPTYTTFTQCGPAKFPLGDGYQNAVWWDNVTRFRRGAFRIDMTGIGNCHHKAFDVVYNMGNL
jgi:hypothetical protein